MRRFIEGDERGQLSLLPSSLEDYIEEDNPVRVIDVFIDELDLGALGFAGVVPAATGRPGYHPSTLLKLYLYGYLNRVQSSRRLEHEAKRNVEVMWLTGRLAPDFKTIADFRRDNGAAIQAVCAKFVEICTDLGLFRHAVAAIDGAKFKAVNSRDRNFTRGKLKRRMEQISASIGRYLDAIEAADLQDDGRRNEKITQLTDKVAAMRTRLAELKELEKRVHEAPDKQISLTDPDARAMATNMRGASVVGYNVQAAVDTEHHLIVTHQVTNIVVDRTLLAPMAEKAGHADQTARCVCRPWLLQRRAAACMRRDRCHAVGAQATNIKCQSCRQVRQGGFRVSARSKCLSMPGRRDVAISVRG